MEMNCINDCVKNYLSHGGGGIIGYGGWTISAGSATVAGRGVVATRDYSVGDVIFVDVPLIVSPRAMGTDGTGSPVCPVCYTVVTTPTGCPGGCRWPVCGRQCADRPEHRDECRYVRQLRPKTKSDGQTWSVGIYNAITAVRGLSIRDGRYKYFLDVLQKKLTDKLTFEEFGTELAALNCIVKNCDGRILPINPLDNMSIWQCKICTKLVSSTEMICFYKDVETLMKSISVFCPKSFEAILKSFNIHKDSPFVVDLRLKFIWKSKNNSLNLEQLLYKEKLCMEMLDLIQKLKLGQCRLLGLISLELLKVIREKAYRFRWKWNTKTLNVFEGQISKLKEIYSSVLDEDANLDNNNIQ